MSESWWFQRILQDPAITALAQRVSSTTSVECMCGGGGGVGGGSVLATAALSQLVGGVHVLIVAHLDEADEAADELEALDIPVMKFPALEILPGETSVSPDLLAARLSVLRTLSTNGWQGIIVAPVTALMQRVPGLKQWENQLRVIRTSDKIDRDELAAWLATGGFDRVEAIESPGEFALRGGIIDVFPEGSAPMRIDLFGDEVEGLYEIDLDTMGSDRRLDMIELVSTAMTPGDDSRETINVAQYLPADSVAVLVEMLELTEQGRSYMERVEDADSIDDIPTVWKQLTEHCAAIVSFHQYGIGSGPDDDAIELPVNPLPNFAESAAEAIQELGEIARGSDTIVFCQNPAETQRMGELLDEHLADSSIKVETHYLHRGLIWGETGGGNDNTQASRPLAMVPYHELLNRYQTRRRIRRISSARTMDNFLDLAVGDYVVHRDHGIAKFSGLRTMRDEKGGEEQEFLTLEFARGAKVHVPASKIELVQKYIGAFRARPERSVLGGKRWKKQKEQVSEAVRDLAAEMLRLQAAREALPGTRYPADTAWQREFEAEFPYEETDDQIVSITAVKRDLEQHRPMDRLICGDVGFGKTEIAIRAAFKTVEYGKQVAVLVPTTVLAEQHGRTFRERFADYPFVIESISRFKTRMQQNELLQRLQQGTVDIIIGTHRLLSEDVKFADLGLVVIDEEQRFGVQHKQRLLEFRTTAEVLTMSATPIPRTLHMALLGLRDISSLTTPPLDRRAIVTEVIGHDSRRIKQALERELAREGQVFFVHNRVHNIHSVADDVQRLVPDARVIVGHGQIPARQLEQVMLKFLRHEADILVCTTIIESGIDIPTANTMIIADAHRFGLSELHQLRGRVGRYKHRAYCYLCLPQDRIINPIAMKRLRALESFTMLGAGFKIALRDLELRGAGNLLGAEQSGHIAAVGYEMYCQLLEHAVSDLKQEKIIKAVDTTLDLGVEGALPKGYIPSDSRRMDAYRRVSQARTTEELSEIEKNMISAYGSLPQAASMLMQLAEIRLNAHHIGIRNATRHEGDIIFKTSQPHTLEKHFAQAKGSLRLVGQPDRDGLSTVYYRPPPQYLEGQSLLTVLRQRLKPIVD